MAREPVPTRRVLPRGFPQLSFRPLRGRPEGQREAVRHAASADGVLLHQVLADEALTKRYGAEGLRRRS